MAPDSERFVCVYCVFVAWLICYDCYYSLPVMMHCLGILSMLNMLCLVLLSLFLDPLLMSGLLSFLQILMTYLIHFSAAMNHLLVISQRATA